MSRLAGKVCVVTGATGMAADAARRFAREGAAVWVIAVDRGECELSPHPRTPHRRSAGPMSDRWTVETITVEKVARTIDHSLLKPELTVDEVLAGCELAAAYDVASVCCRPLDVGHCRDALAGSGVAVGTVVGFPHGSSTTAVKAAEAERALDDGAVELDMVLPIGWLRSGNDAYVKDDIAAVVGVAHARGAIVKVILENAYLTDEQKVRGCQLSEEAGADYVKTSTGYAPSGATMDDIRLMRASVSPRVRVKAAGGIRTLDLLIEGLNAGMDRCGATATAAIIDDLKRRQGS